MSDAGKVDAPIARTSQQVRQRRQRLLDVGIRRGPMHLVEVDIVGPEPAQRIVERPGEPTPRAASPVGIVPHGVERLGGEDDVVAPALECLPDDLFGLAAAVHIGGVDEVDPGIERPVDHPDALVVIGVGEAPEHHGAETVGADRDAGAAERAVVHGDLRCAPSEAP